MNPLLHNILTFALAASSGNVAKNSDDTGQHLTWQELGQQLLSMKNGGIPDDALMGTRLTSLPLSRTRIDESLNRGRGLFASENCKEGDLLTCYPGDILLHSELGFRPTPAQMGIENDEMLRDYLCRYCIGLTDDYALMGLPHLDQDMAYAGHFINDGVTTPPAVEDELEDYLQESSAKANAQFLPLENLHLVALATRDIQKGEEVFVCYGPVYWMEHTSTWRGPKTIE